MSRETIRFGPYTADFRNARLLRDGSPIRLQDKPLQVLQALLEQPGELVTRETLRQRLWPADVFVDFDRSLNAALRRLRRVLEDDAEEPRYIETVPKHGYRFIGRVEVEAPLEPAAPSGPGRRNRRERTLLVGAAVVALVLAGLVGSRLIGARSSRIGSLAVLPLANLSGDPDQDYFAEGMTEALIGSLGRAKDLRVISRQSVMRYRGSAQSAPAIARELKVEALVEGSVVPEGDRVRVTVQLIQAEPERHLWAESYERDLRDILILQDEIATTIAAEIRAKLARPEGPGGGPTREVDPEAYRAYLRGRYHYHQWPQDLDKAVASFQESIRKDPTYAPAYAGLSLCYGSLGYFRPPGEMLSRARAAAQKALELDEGQSEAHAALGVVLLNYDWDWDAAGREFRRAVELDPGSVDARARRATYLLSLGRFDEAVAEAARAAEIDPLSAYAHTRLGWICLGARRYDEALVHFREATELDPHFSKAQEWTLFALMLHGRFDEAFASYDALGWGPDPARVWLLAAAGRRGEAAAMFRQLDAPARPDGWDPYLLAIGAAGLGRHDRAVELLREAYDRHNTQLYMAWMEPFFDGLRDDPRFWDIVDRVGPPERLRSSVGVLGPRQPAVTERP